MEREYLKTHNYDIVKTYTPEEIKAHGDKEYFYDKEVTEKRIKLWRARILNKIGYQCVEDNCELHDFHFGLGIDKGGGIHLDLYGLDEQGDLVMITLDHIKPKSKGGKNEVSNYQPMCKPHNEEKADNHNFKRQFKDLNLIYPDEPMVTQNYMIYKKKLTEKERDEFENLGGVLADKYLEYFAVGEQYVLLDKRGEGVMMSDHPSETMSNQKFINQAHGHVLIFGLGLGLIIFPLLMDDDIESITVIEKDRGLIQAVGDIIKEHDYENKLNIIEGDAFEYHNKTHIIQKYDAIYFDIWIRIDEDAFKEMDQLHDLYRKFMKGSSSYIDSWCYEMKDDYFKKHS